MVNVTDPVRIAVLLFPALTALDIFAPLNSLNLMSIAHPMTLSLLSTTLDSVPIDRSFLPGSMFETSASPNFSQRILPTHTLEEARSMPFDVVLTPGGSGTRNLNVTQPHVDFLAERWDHPELKYMMTVCTGTALLSRTGKIDGMNATTNKAAFKWVSSQRPQVNWIGKARWVVDGKLWTSSGVSAGGDMMLGWLEMMYGHDEFVRVKNMMEWNYLGQSEDPFAEIFGVE
ncbi:class I glutamine amidotransferase-like protein [Patellaria atrata CBS 101060]|uniref:Class I glutamine amidotransferase-like protein n=1 Tax=Patellaria atrata CBS 101060 TaxID=1346257 RepID=A0A9P4SEY3_9PEZI|nr:class I glutamine amidotransferase-like protein [Patellaria atrata CBS 101060]